MKLSPSSHCCAAILLAGSASFTTYAQSKLPADLDPQSRARLPYLKKSDMDAKGQKIFDTLPGAGKDDMLRGPLAFAGYNPAVAQALFDLHNAAVPGGTLDPHTRELAILVACRETNYNLEWNGHEPSAVKAGIDARVIDVVRNNGALDGLNEKDATVIRFGRQLFRDFRKSCGGLGQARHDGYGGRHEHLCGERLFCHRRRRALSRRQA